MAVYKFKYNNNSNNSLYGYRMIWKHFSMQTVLRMAGGQRRHQSLSYLEGKISNLAIMATDENKHTCLNLDSVQFGCELVIHCKYMSIFYFF